MFKKLSGMLTLYFTNLSCDKITYIIFKCIIKIFKFDVKKRQPPLISLKLKTYFLLFPNLNRQQIIS